MKNMLRKPVVTAVLVTVVVGLMAMGATAAASEGGGEQGYYVPPPCVPLPEGHALNAKKLALATYNHFAGSEHFPSVGQLEEALPAIMSAAGTDDPAAVAWLRAEVSARQPNGVCPGGGDGPGDEPPAGGDEPGHHGDEPGDHHGDEPGAGDDESGDKPGFDGVPRGGFKKRFLNRVWRFRGEDPVVDGNVMNVTLLSIQNLPRRFRHQDDELIDQDLLVKLGERTRLRDCEGHHISAPDLEGFDQVSVRAKLLRPSRWLEDQDGEVTPTVRAKYVAGVC